MNNTSAVDYAQPMLFAVFGTIVCIILFALSLALVILWYLLHSLFRNGRGGTVSLSIHLANPQKTLTQAKTALAEIYHRIERLERRVEHVVTPRTQLSNNEALVTRVRAGITRLRSARAGIREMIQQLREREPPPAYGDVVERQNEEPESPMLGEISPASSPSRSGRGSPGPDAVTQDVWPEDAGQQVKSGNETVSDEQASVQQQDEPAALPLRRVGTLSAPYRSCVPLTVDTASQTPNHLRMVANSSESTMMPQLPDEYQAHTNGGSVSAGTEMYPDGVTKATSTIVPEDGIHSADSTPSFSGSTLVDNGREDNDADDETDSSGEGRSAAHADVNPMW